MSEIILQINSDDSTADGNSISPVPWVTGVQAEGIACLMGAPGAYDHVLFVADPSQGRIVLLDETKDVNPIINANFITGLAGVAYIALSHDGHNLYVAQENAGLISEYNALTGALITSVSFAGAHDVLVGADGSVYATAYGSSQPLSQGVVKFNADLTSSTPFILPGDNGLKHATGMAFDNSGNLWVANAGTIRGDGPDFVSEYSSTGTFITKVVDDGTHKLLNPFGLSRGDDGNIYAASFGTYGQYDGSIAKIDVNTDALSTFIAAGSADSDAGLNPKYALFEADCVTYATPEPSSIATAGFGLLVGVGAIVRRRKSVV